MIFVVGSGPAGVCCAHALVRQGLDVTMLDAGIELEGDRREAVEILRSTKPEQWDRRLVENIIDRGAATTRGLPVKYVHGSDFAYREAAASMSLVANGTVLRPSFAKGGLSNVWGGAILPYTSGDFMDWPITVKELASHYRAVSEFVTIAAVKDDLEPTFPLYHELCHELRPSRQAQALMADLELNKAALRAGGIICGSARLAVQANPTPTSSGCVYCGMCLHGCPYGVIYNAASTLQELQRNLNFRYIQNVIVRKIKEPGEGVRILAESRQDGRPVQYSGDRVYLAGGVLPTSRILLDSLEAYDHPLIMRYSQYFLLPLLRYRSVPSVREESLHTLAQIFLEMYDEALSEHTIHLQVYTYNDLYLGFMRRLLNLAYPLMKIPVDALLGRLLIIQGYLHSNLSPTISLELRGGEKRVSNQLVLEASPSEDSKRVIRGIVRTLFRHRRNLKAIPILPLLKIGSPGAGFHAGGTFPMRANPKEFESDCLGRPHGFRRVHIVDATVFPSIPAVPITYTVMANAHRIASAHARV